MVVKRQCAHCTLEPAQVPTFFISLFSAESRNYWICRNHCCTFTGPMQQQLLCGAIMRLADESFYTHDRAELLQILHQVVSFKQQIKETSE
mmetsp:Transcript_10683/g.14978  ORF Transcript_10683/g.14978 Transcript_10683/m.14978 type:complete len:91 (+) Transcript_10683:83-355(+)